MTKFSKSHKIVIHFIHKGVTMRLKIITVALLAAVSLYAGNYKVDTSHSKVAFKIKHLMISNVTGHFDEFKGTFQYDEKTGVLKALNGEVSVKSINTAVDKRDNHLRSADFFDVNKFPTMTLELIRANDQSVEANLTIKGISKHVLFEFENGGSAIAPNGVKKAGFSMSAKINRADFGLTWNKALETGGVVVGDTVRISIDIEGDAL